MKWRAAIPRLERIVASRWFLVATLAAAALLRVWHVLAIRELPLFDRLIIDSEVYDAWARHVAGGDWWSALLGRPFFMDPLYPYFLAVLYRVVGRDLLVVRLVQVAFGVGSCGLAAVLGRRLHGAAAGNLAALLLALYPPAIFQEVEFEKTALGVLLATSALVLFLSRRAWAPLAAGAVLGLAALARGNVLLLAPFAVLYLVALRRWQAATAFALGAALALAPAAWRNHRVSGEWVLTTSGAGQNFYIGNNPANPDGAYHSVPFARPQAAHEEGDFLAEAERQAGRPLSATEASSWWFRESLRHIAESPEFAATVLIRKAGLFWTSAETVDAWAMSFVSKFSLPLRLPLVSFPLLVGLAVIGAFPAARCREGRVVLAFVLLYSASVVAFFVFSRFRLHVVPALAALGGVGVLHAIDCARERRWRRLVAPGVAAAMVAGFAALSFPTRRGEAIGNYAMLAEMYEERNDFPRAEAVLADALSQVPGDASILCGVGKLKLRTGRPAEAVEYVTRCLDSNPGYPDGWYLLGLTLEAAHDRERAVEAHRQQLLRVPGHEGARARLELLR